MESRLIQIEKIWNDNKEKNMKEKIFEIFSTDLESSSSQFKANGFYNPKFEAKQTAYKENTFAILQKLAEEKITLEELCKTLIFFQLKLPINGNKEIRSKIDFVLDKILETSAKLREKNAGWRVEIQSALDGEKNDLGLSKLDV